MDKKMADKKIELKEMDYDKKNIEKVLIENFVSLQKVLVNLSVKFDGLAKQISKLLELFEMSAKSLAEKDFEIEKNSRENARILEKIENVLEQNKIIARGLTLMHNKINEPQGYPPQMPERPRVPPQQKPPFRPPQKNMMEGISDEYHRPISSNEH